MFQIRYPIIASIALLAFGCNHDNEAPPSVGADADARAPSASDAVSTDTANNFDSVGGTTNQAGDIPGPVGGSSMAGIGGGVGRSGNDGDKAPSTMGTGQ